MAAYLEQDSGFFTRRGMVLVAIIALHVFIFWALATGLARRAVEMIAPPIQTVIETETHKEAPPPPPPPPTFERPPVEIPPTDTIVEMPVAAGHHRDQQHDHPARRARRRPAHPGAQDGAEDRQGLPEHGRLSTRRPPSASTRRARRRCTCASARAASSPKRRRSPQTSGSPRLDEGALNLVKAGASQHPARHRGRQAGRCVLRVPHQVPDEIMH